MNDATRRDLWNRRCQCGCRLDDCACVDRCADCGHVRTLHQYDGDAYDRSWGVCDVDGCDCGGFDDDEPMAWVPCPVCDGSGGLGAAPEREPQATAIPCPRCDGTGDLPYEQTGA